MPDPSPAPAGDWQADLDVAGPLAAPALGRKVGLVDLVPTGRRRDRR